MLRDKQILRFIRVICCSLLLAGLFFSCVNVKPSEFTYFRSSNPAFPQLVETSLPRISTIQRGDILGVLVSTLNKESNEFLNFANINAIPVTVFSGSGASSGSQPLGFPVDSLGYITMPVIGRQRVGGLTLTQAEVKLHDELEKTLKETSVSVRFMNHKFSVLGEVGQVGTYNLLDDQTTLLDVLATCGDLTEYAKRDSITVIRYKNGMREIGKVNMQTQAVFKSPYFYVQNGDVIYVEPTKDKLIPPRPLGPTLQRIPIYLSLATSILSLIFLATRL